MAAVLVLGGRVTPAARADSVGLKFLFATSKSATNQCFSGPQGLAYDSSRDELLVADTGNGQVVVLSPNGVPLDRVRHRVRGREGQMIVGEPFGVLPGDKGTVVVTDRLSEQVDVLNARGVIVRSINPAAALNAETQMNPGRIDWGDDGGLYVLEQNTGQVLVFSREGELVRRFGRRGKGEGRFEKIADVAVSRNGIVYVLDSIGTPVVQAFDEQGRWLFGFGQHTDKPEGFHFPVGMTVDRAGRVWVSDAFSHEVKAYDAAGQFLGAFGELGTEPGQFYSPSDVVATGDGRLYVLEKAGRRLQAFEIMHPK